MFRRACSVAQAGLSRHRLDAPCCFSTGTGWSGRSCGLVGMPNVGKSTLFNALVERQKAESANFPFCTIEPNIGRVSVPDARLKKLAEIHSSEKVTGTQIEFRDVAGLLRGASQGEGLGNKFLSHIRSVSCIVHVVRCFDDSEITHVESSVDPVRDMETINTELCLSDLEILQRRFKMLEKRSRSASPQEKKFLRVLDNAIQILNDGKLLVGSLEVDDEVAPDLHALDLLTMKRAMCVANVDIPTLQNNSTNKYTTALNEYLRSVWGAHHANTDAVVLCAKLEEEASVLSEGCDTERRAVYEAYGLQPPLGRIPGSEATYTITSLEKVITQCYDMLGLQVMYTAGEKESRAWTIPRGATAKQAAGCIHSDMERGFIRAEVVSFDDYVAHNGVDQCKQHGLLRLEGKDYVMSDGDVCYFRFNV